MGEHLKDARRHRRIPYTGPIRISWNDASGSPRFANAKCIEVSESGIRIEVPVNIAARTTLMINAERIKLAGSASVRHVVRHGAKYLLGLELSQHLNDNAMTALREPWALRQEVPVA